MKHIVIATTDGPKTVPTYGDFMLHGERFSYNKNLRGEYGVTHTRTGRAASDWCLSRKSARENAEQNFEAAFKEGKTMQTLLNELPTLNNV